MKAHERHRVLRKQRYNVARELGATWQRAQSARQNGESFLAFLAEVGVAQEPYMHLYCRPQRLVGPRTPEAEERVIRYRLLRQRGYSAADAAELRYKKQSFEQAMEITDP